MAKLRIIYIKKIDKIIKIHKIAQYHYEYYVLNTNNMYNNKNIKILH